MVEISREVTVEPMNKIDIQSLVENCKKSLGSEKKEKRWKVITLSYSSATSNPGRRMAINKEGEKAEDRIAWIQEIQRAGKDILWRVAKIATHSIVSKAFSISI